MLLITSRLCTFRARSILMGVCRLQVDALCLLQQTRVPNFILLALHLLQFSLIGHFYLSFEASLVSKPELESHSKVFEPGFQISDPFEPRKSSVRRRVGLLRLRRGRQEVAGEGQGRHERQVSYFLTQTVHIRLVLPQASQLGINFFKERQ